jgi:hypothetical protein
MRRRLSPVGKDPLRGRDFVVQYAPNIDPNHEVWSWIPDELRRFADDPDFNGWLNVYGDFEVCRLAPEKPDHMGFICIQTAKHLVVVRDR